MLKKVEYKSMTVKYIAEAGTSVIIVAGFGTTGAWGIIWLFMTLTSWTNLKMGFPSLSTLDFFTGKMGVLQEEVHFLRTPCSR